MKFAEERQSIVDNPQPKKAERKHESERRCPSDLASGEYERGQRCKSPQKEVTLHHSQFLTSRIKFLFISSPLIIHRWESTSSHPSCSPSEDRS
jgi:hypothetical protein